MQIVIWVISCLGGIFVGWYSIQKVSSKRIKFVISFILVIFILCGIWFIDLEPPWENSTIRDSGVVLNLSIVYLLWGVRFLILGIIFGSINKGKET